MYQNGQHLAVIATAWTTREITVCALNVQAEVWVEGIGGANTARGNYSAEAVQAQAVPRLFGNYTLAYPDIADSRAANGFEALAFMENPLYGVSHSDDQIDARDAVFSRLLLWRDANHNGISEPDELKPAADFGLQAISTDYRLSRRADRHGNEFRQRAKSTWRAENGTLFTHPVFDVWLLVDSASR